MSENFGLYIHIPFCTHLCHYCDFAKTARHNDDSVAAYFNRLKEELGSWLNEMPELSFSSVFFGGGTPGLFSNEYVDLFEVFSNRIRTGAEISLEANPNNLSDQRLKVWRGLGFNRLSVGIQSFDLDSLRFLTRDHTREDSLEGIARAKKYFSNINLDLIYGLPNQELEEWGGDLELAVSLEPQHLSLYHLTYEERTVIGRKAIRGKIIPAEDERLESMYEHARQVLHRDGWVHDEVSNWSKNGFTCHHNWVYWQDQSYLAVGVGAHGYFRDRAGIGRRYAYPRSLKSFLDGSPYQVDQRDKEAWLLEYLGSALRTIRGIDLKRINDVTGRDFILNDKISRAINDKLIFRKQNHIVLRPDEWFREVYWAIELETCFSLRADKI